MYDPNAQIHFQLHRKDTAAAFLFWFFLGMYGAHRFYMGKTGSAVAMLVITLVSIPLCFVLIGFLTLFAVSIWWIVDAFLICPWINQHNAQLAYATLQHSRSAGYSPLPPPR